MEVSGLLLDQRELVCYFELIHHFICLWSDYMLVTHFETFSLRFGISSDCQSTHPCDVVSGIDTEVLRFIVGLYLPVVDSGHSFDQVDHSSPLIRRRLINKLVVDEWPNTFILMHMRTDIEVHHSLPLELR